MNVYLKVNHIHIQVVYTQIHTSKLISFYWPFIILSIPLWIFIFKILLILKESSESSRRFRSREKIYYLSLCFYDRYILGSVYLFIVKSTSHGTIFLFNKYHCRRKQKPYTISSRRLIKGSKEETDDKKPVSACFSEVSFYDSIVLFLLVSTPVRIIVKPSKIVMCYYYSCYYHRLESLSTIEKLTDPRWFTTTLLWL